jgi:hypothetical protein
MFFELLFGDQEGWFTVATTHPDMPKTTFKQSFFVWPDEFLKVENHILKYEEKLNVYFCVNLLENPQRIKANALPSNFIWSDLDGVSPDSELLKTIPPGILVSSSDDKWQAYWRTTTKLEPRLAENYSRRMAYYVGADKSGWDLTQLMRVPLTTNFKYKNKPGIDIVRALETQAPPALFDTVLPMVEDEKPPPGYSEMPNLNELPIDEAVIYKYRTALNKSVFSIAYFQEPGYDDDWSTLVWKLIHICFEAGMEPEEVFAVMLGAPCNKYARDGRPPEHLWRDVTKAHKSYIAYGGEDGFTALEMLELVKEPHSTTFIDQYKDWAVEATDAVEEYHELAAAMLLSAVIANSVTIETQYDKISPNLWGMLLGDSTLTRKTTAMKMAVDFVMAIDPEMIVATEGSAEGILEALAVRPNKTSVFFKDEISGLFESMRRKEYLSGMPETLTQLYDCPPVFRRKLRKETISIEHPIFIFFGGGVRDRVYESVNEEYVTSGFLPRFLVVSGDPDFERIKPTGPPTEIGTNKRSLILARIADIYELYSTEVVAKIGGQKVRMPQRFVADPTLDAWKMFQDFELRMDKLAAESSIRAMAQPTFSRLSKSMLKLSVLFAAERQVPADNKIIVEEGDVLNAAWYIQRWGRHSIQLITNAGTLPRERMMEKVYKIIVDKPGILRGSIMKRYKLDKRDADLILGTLEERGLVTKERSGTGWRYWPT